MCRAGATSSIVSGAGGAHTLIDSTGVPQGGPIGPLHFFIYVFTNLLHKVDVSRRTFDSYAYVVAF